VTWSSRVRYAECDQQGVAFNAHYLTWADEAATDWWAAIGLPWDDLVTRGGEAMVRASTLEWTSSARWGDTVTVVARVEKLGRTSLTVRFAVSAGGRHCCTILTTYVWVTPDGSAPWPEDVRGLLSEA
jgi:acyl-CoA thioester hydrolase